ncbi:hypothetical protein B0H13DRAFT_2577822 [Mycena leptocephala]|nr:hypothetical protein B0H13DRAFT_2577822 [Mycena leptocephala]
MDEPKRGPRSHTRRLRPLPSLKAALVGVTVMMDSIDRVGDVNDEFVRIANNVKGFQGIFSQYGAEKDISPAMCNNLDVVTSELKLIEGAIGSKTERGRARRAIEAPDDVEKVVIAFKRFGDVIDRFQLDMGLRTTNYYMNVYGRKKLCWMSTDYSLCPGGLGGAGGMSEQGTGGNGGVGQGPTLKISATHCTVNNLSTGSAAVPVHALEKLGYIAAADIDAQSPEGCLEGTRVDLLADLQAWSRDPNSPGSSGWMEWLGRASCVKISSLAGASSAFEAMPAVVIQNTFFLLSPYSSLPRMQLTSGGTASEALRSVDSNALPTLVLVIDALDELDGEHATKDLLQRLVSTVPSLPIKLFVTSRPERHIRPQFDNPADFQRVVRLHDIEDNIVTADISLYLTTRLAGLRAENSSTLPPTWASSADVEALTSRAGKLFIYAFTVVEYIRENPRDRLQTLISIKVDTKGPLTKPLDNIYTHILWDSMNPDRRESREIALTKRIIAAVLTVRKPLSVATLGGLLGEPAWQVREMLTRLHAVIHVPTDDEEGILSTFHASFGDFLTTTGRAPDDMLINPFAAHAALFSNCIRVMKSDELCFNVSKCPTSYFPNTYHQLTIPALLQYVCLHWPHHIAAASATEASDVEVFITSSHLNSLQDVFLPKFLFWVEVLSAMNKANVLSSLIMTVLPAKCSARAP